MLDSQHGGLPLIGVVRAPAVEQAMVADSGQWWQSASDGSRKGNVVQMQKKMEMAAEGGGWWCDGGSGQRGQQRL